MTYVEEYFGRVELRMPGVKRRVFLASDDPTTLPEAKKKYVCSCLVKSHRLGAKPKDAVSDLITYIKL